MTMRVLHIEAGKYLYGGAKQVAYLIQGLAQHKIYNILACPIGSDIGDYISNKHNSFVKVEEIAMNGDVDFVLVFRLFKLIRHHKPDFVLCHSRRGADIMGLLAAKLTGTKVICVRRVDNTEPHWLAKLKYHSFYKTVCISEAIQEVLHTQGVKPNSTMVIRSVIDTDEYIPQTKSDYLYQQFNLNNDTVVIACIAQLIARKGQALLLQAFSDLTVEYPNIHLLICGKGPKLAEYQVLSEQLNICHKISFVGFRDDIQLIMPQLDLLVHPASTEGLGVTLMQASACEVPIVACRAGGIPEVVIDKHNGILVDIDDKVTLTSSIKYLLDNPEERRQMAKNGRIFVEQNCSIKSMVNSYLSLFADLSK